ncbi:hypothetical protein HNQ94_003257 [Salirhabdus euzebyi]|uniref:LIM zinc-binding domain-containing protein n=1 Tax=Salirhabdus euzebyi TaxID=394506 RepID=A0A841Q8N9_9BACI|nr:hypothetical protein [Salirhabdus euzebyi]MBB6454768.1 hypothetical protein [Salirhabdus euzebyi]
MEEFLGNCSVCGKAIYCRNGFFDGATEDGHLYCFDCVEQNEN